MSDHNLRRVVALELRLAVAHAKFERLRLEAEDMVNQILGDHSNKRPKEQAERLQDVLRELENTAVNLH